MKKQRISEVAPLLSLDHLAVTLSFTDSRHAALDITTERLKLQWTPAAHLSTVHLLVGLAETAFLFPPLPALPQPYVVPAVASGPPFVLSVSGKVRPTVLLLSTDAPHLAHADRFECPMRSDLCPQGVHRLSAPVQVARGAHLVGHALHGYEAV